MLHSIQPLHNILLNIVDKNHENKVAAFLRPTLVASGPETG